MSDYNKYFFDSAQYKSAINDLEEFVFKHKIEFLTKCLGINTLALIKFSINSEFVEFTVMTESGQCFNNSIKLQDLMLWVAEIDEKEQRDKLKDFNLELEDLVKFLFKVQVGDLTCRLAAQILEEKIVKLEQNLKHAN